ncbi:MAG: tRNA (guanosine(46)-N7)-methyltransferase TrmB [Bacilli bacterium]|nr:tRNA (guanosine(46)-N7)-methyltransferase TrmB [Bacilli bacterium]MBQ6282666.1 tRNA (guanosine(46)-N7)-methyltransferase TrmB [Bacilli bacterium]
MRLRKLKNSKELIDNSKYIVLNPSEYKGEWKKVFNNSNPIHIEIGMGKGKFILENAIKNPNINYIGIEKFDSAISRAIKKIENYKLDNIRLIRIDAEELSNVFNSEVDTLYLNFSDPWPKDRHEKRRLTHKHFLDIYDIILKNKLIIQKTDNRKLFEYSICSLVDYGYKIEKISLDLHKDSQDIVTTEYEEKFMKIGPIYMAIYKK